MKDHFDRLVVAFILLVFLALLSIFHRDNFELSFFEHSADMALGCLLGMVKASNEPEKKKGDL